ncbi:MAG: hypothetical protein LBP19_05355 [Treponema sp.]|jgi:predicted KAP-like P-loop ATPase|nr:hypothetical protein [Treponema sp.]
MALNGVTLGDAIANILMDANAPEDMKTNIKTLWEQIGAAIVSHIQANGIVTVQAGIPVSTTGSPAAQTGATTAPGTGTIA